MTALYRSGRQAEGLVAYQNARRGLVDELGIDPSPALQELERAILGKIARLTSKGRHQVSSRQRSGGIHRRHHP